MGHSGLRWFALAAMCALCPVALGQIKWVLTLDEARARAGEKGLLMVYVSEKVRPDAVRFRQTILGSADFTKVVKGATCVDLESGSKEGSNMRVRFGVDLTPLVMFLDRGGYEFGRIVRNSSLGGALFEAKRAVRIHQGYWAARETLKSQPNNPEAHLALAEVFAQRSGMRLVEHHFKQAQAGSIEPERLARACLTIGDMYQNRRDYDKAIGFFAQAEQGSSDPNTQCYALFSTGYCLLSKQQRSSAKEYFLKAAAIVGAEPDWIRDSREQAQRIPG